MHGNRTMPIAICSYIQSVVPLSPGIQGWKRRLQLLWISLSLQFYHLRIWELVLYLCYISNPIFFFFFNYTTKINFNLELNSSDLLSPVGHYLSLLCWAYSLFLVGSVERVWFCVILMNTACHFSSAIYHYSEIHTWSVHHLMYF